MAIAVGWMLYCHLTCKKAVRKWLADAIRSYLEECVKSFNDKSILAHRNGEDFKRLDF